MENINRYSTNLGGYYEKREQKNTKKLFFRVIIAVISVLILSFLIASLFSLIGFGENEQEYTKHQVEAGESLWSIAVFYNEDNIDIRKAIYHIKKANNIESSAINPGEELIIPVN
ncbi:MAG: cell division suppressor protein YneA [Halanaerobium sp.]